MAVQDQARRSPSGGHHHLQARWCPRRPESGLVAEAAGKINGNLIINRVVTSTDRSARSLSTLGPGDTDTVGRLQPEVEATWADGTKTTFPPDKYLEVDIIPDLG